MSLLTANPQGSPSAGGTLGLGVSAASGGLTSGGQSGAVGTSSLFSNLGSNIGPAVQGNLAQLGQMVGAAANAGIVAGNAGQNYAGLQAINTPTIQGLQAQYNLGAADLQNNAAQYSNNVANTQNTYNNQTASLGLQQQGNNIQYQGTQRDANYATDSYNNSINRLNQEQGYIGQQGGFAQTDYNNEATYDSQQSGLSNQLMALQQQGAGITQSDADRNARYATEASGAGTTSQGYGANLQSAANTFANESATAKNTNDQSQSLLQRRGADALSTLNKTNASLADQTNQIGNTRIQDNLDNQEKQGQISDQQKQLYLTAAQYGINQNQLNQSLNSTLKSLNLQNSATAASILTGMSSTNSQIQQFNTNLYLQAIANAQH